MGCGTRMVAGLVCLGSAAGLLAGETPRWQWKLGEFTWVKRVAAEAGAPLNDQPVQVKAEALRQQLAAVRFTSGTESEALFAKEELAQLLGPLCEALSVAGPGEDLLLLSTHRRGGSFLNTAKGLTVRLFVQGGGLNLIVHDTRLDFVDQYRGMQILPEFRFGARSIASAVALTCPGATSRRSDWLVFPLEPLKAAPEVAPSARATPTLEALAAPTTVRDAAFFEAQEKRLRALKRMREENLITEDEYQQKRRDVLQGL